MEGIKGGKRWEQWIRLTTQEWHGKLHALESESSKCDRRVCRHNAVLSQPHQAPIPTNANNECKWRWPFHKEALNKKEKRAPFLSMKWNESKEAKGESNGYSWPLHNGIPADPLRTQVQNSIGWILICSMNTLIFQKWPQFCESSKRVIAVIASKSPTFIYWWHEITTMWWVKMAVILGSDITMKECGELCTDVAKRPQNDC
jgi:hypothetical protein